MENIQLTKDDLLRYNRHLNLQSVGIEGQKRLKAAKILCVGAGGLGSPLLLYLCAAGIGRIGIVDFDQVEVTNLQRQILFANDDLHKKKVYAAKHRLTALNPLVHIDVYDEKIQGVNALNIFSEYDLVVDATDNFTTRYLINDACFHLYKPYVFASIYQFEGQCTVFDRLSGGSCYRCLFPEKPIQDLVPNCVEAGVLGVLPGIMGCLQANEVLKRVLQIGEPLIDKLIVFNALTVQLHEFKVHRNPNCVLCHHKVPFERLVELGEPNQECSFTTDSNLPLDEITPRKLSQLLKTTEFATIQLLDVRERHEYDICHLNALLIPLAELPQKIAQLDPQKFTIVYCKSGMRGRVAVKLLKEHGFKNIKNLNGGILRWISEINPEMESY